MCKQWTGAGGGVGTPVAFRESGSGATGVGHLGVN